MEMFEHKGVNKILYGGDYNPEQWDEDMYGHFHGCISGMDGEKVS